MFTVSNFVWCAHGPFNQRCLLWKTRFGPKKGERTDTMGAGRRHGIQSQENQPPWEKVVLLEEKDLELSSRGASLN